MNRRLTVAAIVLPLLLLAVVFMGVNKQERVYNANSTGHHAVGGHREVRNPPASSDAQDGAPRLRYPLRPQPCAGDPLAAPRQTYLQTLARLSMTCSRTIVSTSTFIVTAYCPCKKCCGPQACGITASGKPVTANGSLFVAADRSIPFGTKIKVPGYADGKAVPVLDRGGAIKGNRLDVYFPTHQAALNWGRQTLTVEIER